MSQTDLAPIAVFAYNRPNHTRMVVESLLRNCQAKNTELFVFSDGAKNEADIKRVAEVRAYINRVCGFKSVNHIERQHNVGLSRSITQGVGKLCESHGKVVVLEDDILVSEFFLEYVNGALDLYEKDERVTSIGCYTFPVSGALAETFFLRIPDCWGWGVWKRSWDLYEPNGQKLLDEIKSRGLEQEFDLGGAYPYTQMLEEQIAGRNDSWAVRWYARAFLLGKLTLYPGRSMSCNLGMDDSGVHSGLTSAYDVEMGRQPIRLARIPIEENADACAQIRSFLIRQKEGRSLRDVLRRLIASVKRRLG